MFDQLVMQNFIHQLGLTFNCVLLFYQMHTLLCRNKQLPAWRLAVAGLRVAYNMLQFPTRGPFPAEIRLTEVTAEIVYDQESVSYRPGENSGRQRHSRLYVTVSCRVLPLLQRQVWLELPGRRGGAGLGLVAATPVRGLPAQPRPPDSGAAPLPRPRQPCLPLGRVARHRSARPPAVQPGHLGAARQSVVDRNIIRNGNLEKICVGKADKA